MPSLKSFPDQKLIHNRLLFSFLILGFLLRIVGLLSLTPFFSDQEWFYQSAVNSLLSGHFPLLGITTSITWLHQGPLWTYLLIPILTLSDFHPLSGSFLSIGFSLVTILLFFYSGLILFGRRTGILAAFIYTFLAFSVVQSRISYHTSPIPLFTLTAFLLLFRNRQFFSGLFFGFMYQLHLLTFIFWPLAIYFSYRRFASPVPFLLGFILGIIPFLFSGPVQTFGIFFWLVKYVSGFSSSSGLSVAYQMVLLVPFVLLFARLVSLLRGKYLYLFCLLFLIVNLYSLVVTRYQTISSSSIPTLSGRIQPGTICRLDPAGYLYWWSNRQGLLNCNKIAP